MATAVAYGTQNVYNAGETAGPSSRPILTVDVQASNRGRHQQVDPRLNQAAQNQQQYSPAQEAHSIMEDESPVSSGDEVAESLQVRNGDGSGGGGAGDEHDAGEGDDQDDSGSFSDSLSSSPSIPDEDIDFALVYALHTFLATVDGQASVVKGDKLLLLDDSNSYWWLVRVLKTQAVGYIPAENIETPFERLARLNKHRNVDLTSVTQEDVITGPGSTITQSRFQGRIPPSQQPHPHQSQHPSAKGVIASPSHKDHPRNISPSSDRPERSASRKAKTVIFTAPTYYEHSANGETDDEEEYDEDMEDGEGQLSGEQVFDDDDGEESEFSDDNLTEEDGTEIVTQQGQVAGRRPEIHAGQVLVQDEGHDGGDEEEPQWDDASARAHAEAEARWRQEQQQQQQQQVQQRALSPQQQQRALSPQQQQRALSPQQQQQLYAQQAQQAHQQQQQLFKRQHEEAVRLQAFQQQQLNESQQRQQYELQQHEQELRQQQARLQQQQQQQDAHSQQRAASAGGQYTPPKPESGHQRRVSDPNSSGSQRRPSETSSMRSVAEDPFDADAPTKKLTATPPIVRDPTFDMNNPLGERSSSPVRVRGVEVVDPKDPRYQKLISERRAADEFGAAAAVAAEGDTSLNSMDTGSSVTSVPRSDDSHLPTASSPVSGPAGKKGKKASRESVDASDGEKKRKSGGILGLFRKKDKKKKEDVKDANDAARRSSEDSLGRSTGASSYSPPGTASPRASTERSAVAPAPGVGSTTAGRRESQTAESMFSTDAALRQQQVEAKQAMYHQYGVQRAPGDVTNTMTPRNASMQHQNLSPTTGFAPSPLLPPGQRMRPGSLIGSPSIPGLDVPLLSVLRVFAGDNIESEATFKTVLLNRSTSSADLVMQSMQRFRLQGSEDRDEYYLTVKEIGGEERPLLDDQKPLIIFEHLSEHAGGSGFAIPSVKRSSIGSISSISSSLSLNPAITRLGMNDFSDDSAVKFYLNRRLPEDPALSSVTATSDNDSVLTATGPSGLTVEQAAPSSSPSFRFALRILIHPSDLPENVVFDPQSNAIIPKSVLAERLQRAGGPEPEPASASDAREKIIFFPRNANVSEVIEAALDRFGIVDAVVEGGDEVEDRVSKRRSVSRVKYGLCVVRDQQEVQLNPSHKVLDAYGTPPLFKAYDRTSKEFRRRSVDATLILGSSQDIQPSDPVFVIRRTPQRGSGSHLRAGSLSSPRTSRLNSPIIEEALGVQQVQEEVEEAKTNVLEPQRAVAPELSRANTALSSSASSDGYGTATDDHTEELLARAASPQATPQEIIAAQRAVSRANQRAILSAQKNSEQGVDIVLPDRGTIRSSRVLNDRVRYSYIDADGTVDISELVESEWGAGGSARSDSRGTGGSSSSTDADSFHSLDSPSSTVNFSTSNSRGPVSSSGSNEDEDDRAAISRLADAQVPIDGTPRISSPPTSPGSPSRATSAASRAYGADVLQDAIARPGGLHTESLQDRLDRVLAKVRDGKVRSRGSGRASPSVLANGRTSPADRRSPSSSSTPGRRSPFINGTSSGAGGRDSPSIDQLIGSPARSPLSAVHHGKKLSITSESVISSSSNNTMGDLPSTPVTPGSNATNFTPVSSVNSNHRAPVAYRADFGLETLMALVDAAPRAPPRREPAVEGLFGAPLGELDPGVLEVYRPHVKRLDEIDSHLNALLAQLVS